jgi:NAD(P)-dependent dehydrogenase (short-subunit alcohol dehydrogenase family)
MSTFEMTFENWRRQMAIDLDSLFLSTKYGVPLVKKSGGGSIINISSLAGLKGVPKLSGYCAAKAGVMLFSQSMALELAQMRANIRVNTIHPGAIETSIWLKMPNDGSMPNVDLTRNSDPLFEQRKIAERTTPVGFAGAPSDIAMGVVYLASDESRFVNGISLVIDGGNMAGDVGDIMAEDLKMS